MNRLLSTSLWSSVLALAAGAAAAAEPPGLIFDTDMGNDTDDALALAVIHALQSRGECRLLAVTITNDHPQAAAYVDAVNTFYGRGSIPIGVVRGGVKSNSSTYLKVADVQDDGRDRYPHRIRSGQNCEEATRVLRRTLAAQPDQSVLVAQVGFSTNLARLLDSAADDDSPLSGRDLVAKKVRLLSLMAGAFQPQPAQNGKRFAEYNMVQDVPSAKKVAENWPTPLVWSGFEIGLAIRYPDESVAEDFRYVPHHPVAEAYWLLQAKPIHRPTWDLTSVLYAVRPERGYFTVSAPGRVRVEADGFTEFAAAAQGPHRYLSVTPEQIARTREALVQLASQPPAGAARP